MKKTRHIAVIKPLFVITLALLIIACKSNNDTSTKAAIVQSFEISINGKLISMEPDNPVEGMLVTLNFVKDQGYFGLAALNKAEDFSFAISGKMENLAVGTYEVYDCLDEPDCDDKNQSVVFAPYPTGQVPNNLDGKLAYKSSELGLTPLTLVITQVEDAVWPGVPGIVKRVKGTFKASLASIEKDKDNHNHIVGPLKQVEGKFDLYCRVL